MIDDNKLVALLGSGLASIDYPASPAGLYRPVEYTLESGGKRLRPLLCLATCDACGAKAENALSQALAIEMFHNFTLIHDDVMDRSDTRRGRPTVYARWGEVQAILSGDALLTMATQMACRCPADRVSAVMELFNTTAMEVYEGQQYDMEFEGRDDVTVDEYLAMIRLKTSVLLGCACRMGALMAGAAEDTARAMYAYGENLGLAFQLRDDWLDTFGDPKIFGKPIGGDIRNRKKTWLFIMALSEAPGQMADALDGSADPVARVTEIYRSLRLDERCGALVEKYRRAAVDALAGADITDDAYRYFTGLAANLSTRQK
ncbi:MAG: polyprenyl synthetase family protein [Muribaculaceae bacterium]|nr:polyprenyl synthetase family protein [Muribaculaceae bacterium]